MYVCWPDAKYGSIGGFAGTVILRKSSDNGVTWSAETIISPLPSAVHSSIATAGSYVHIVWDDERNGAFNSTIQYSMSCDKGLTWSAEQTLGDTLDLDIDASVVSVGSGVFVAWSSRVWTGHADIYARRGEVLTKIAQEHRGLPEGFAVSVYPNPFNASNSIRYTLPRTGEVEITVTDILGRHVQRLVSGIQTVGSYQLMMDAAGWSSGVYYVRIRFEQEQIVKGVIRMR